MLRWGGGEGGRKRVGDIWSSVGGPREAHTADKGERRERYGGWRDGVGEGPAWVRTWEGLHRGVR